MTSEVIAPETSKPKSRKGRLLFVLLLVIGGIGYYIYDSVEKSRLEVLREAVTLKNTSLAQLENLDHRKAEEGFLQIKQLVPEDPLGARNLAVTYLIRIQELDRFREAELFERTVAATKKVLAELKEAAPDDPDVFVLQALFHALLEERDAAVAAYLQAAELDQHDPALAYQAFELMQQAPDEYSAEERLNAIRSAYARNPDNLATVIAYLKILAETESEDFEKQFETSRPLFKPLSSRSRDTLEKLLDQAAAAAKDGAWEKVQTQLGFAGNQLKVEIAFTNDLHRLNPHPLDYAAADFSSRIYDRYPAVRTPNPAPVTVEFDLAELPVPAEATAIGLADLTLDGQDELVVAHANNLSVYSLLDPSHGALFSIEVPISVRGITAADLDRDYKYSKDQALSKGFEGMLDTDLDLILWGEDGLVLLENEWDLDQQQLKLSVKPSPVATEPLQDVRDVAVADLDHDGDLDLAVSYLGGVNLQSNNGNWTFEDFTPFSELKAPNLTSKLLAPSFGSQQLLAVDIDRNVLNDYLVATGAGLQLLENNLHGRYHLGMLRIEAQPLLDVAVLDVNRDASWDILTAGPNGLQLIVGQTLHEGGWKSKEVVTVSEFGAAGVEVWDYNNDGFDDAVSWSESGIDIFTGGPDNQLKHQLVLTDTLPGCTQLRVADIDRDGDQDLLLLSHGRVRPVENRGGNSNHWIDLRLRAEEVVQRPRERCNMHGVGNLIELKTNGVYQSRIVRGPLTHFGLGGQEYADVMRVVWTNGIPNNILSPKQDEVILEQQHLLGSCPYLYTWDGEKFVFATDCLWAAPIGLQFAQGILAPTREWEYLKISGDILKPKEHEYVLQITEELWEAGYFDSVKLMAIDHPADIDVFTNEKVGPAEIAEFKVHTVTQPREPVSVIDQQGRDVSDQTRAADGIYTRTWDRSFTQGLTELHWLELDLGRLQNPKSIKLFLTGWVFPTDTSLNIAISQNPEKPQPKPPALQVPDKNGNWQEVSSYVGFPGGKTKTIVLDLSDQFLTADHRLRIVTNMEIRWDHIFFTVDDPEAQFQLTDLSLKGADLHYRGFSARVSRSNNQHEDYDYSRVTTRPLWPPMGGHFTRYGDVTELIQEADDLQAVLGAGDEMTVRFEVPDGDLPDGWVRDFILFNVGWDKDAGLNTVLGQQVEPLPFRAMKSYPYEPEQSFPDTPRHREFLKKYQTRFQSHPQFRTQIRDWKLEGN